MRAAAPVWSSWALVEGKWRGVLMRGEPQEQGQALFADRWRKQRGHCALAAPHRTE